MVGESKQQWPTGISPHGDGIRIRLWRGGSLVYSETLEGNIYKQADLAAAVKRRQELKSRLDLGLPLFDGDESSATLFRDAAQQFLNSLDADLSTHLSYENALNRYWMPHFSNWLITDISTKHVKNVLAGLKNISQKTKKNIMVPLRGVFTHAMDDGTIKINPVAAVKLKKHQKPKIERFLPHERDAILKQLTGQELVYFAILFGCGLRPGGEVLGLKWSDYDGETIYVHRQVVRRKIKKTTKTHECRRVYVPQWVRVIINAYTETRFGQEGWIFTNGKDTHHSDTDVFNGAWKKALKRAKVPYRIPYVCRHTRAAELLSSGVEPGKAAKQLGHTLEMFYRIYSEWIEAYSNNNDQLKLEGHRPQSADAI